MVRGHNVYKAVLYFITLDASIKNKILPDLDATWKPEPFLRATELKIFSQLLQNGSFQTIAPLLLKGGAILEEFKRAIY